MTMFVWLYTVVAILSGYASVASYWTLGVLYDTAYTWTPMAILRVLPLVLVYPLGFLYTLVYVRVLHGALAYIGVAGPLDRMTRRLWNWVRGGYLNVSAWLKDQGQRVKTKAGAALAAVRVHGWWRWLWSSTGLTWVLAGAVSVTIILYYVRRMRAKAKARETKEARGDREADKYIQFTDYVLNVLNILAGVLAVFTLGVDLGVRRVAMLRWIRDSWRATMGTGAPHVDSGLNETGLADVGRARKRLNDLVNGRAKFRQIYDEREDRDLDDMSAYGAEDARWRAEIDRAKTEYDNSLEKLDLDLGGENGDIGPGKEVAMIAGAQQLWQQFGVPMLVMSVFTGVIVCGLHLWFQETEEKREAKPSRHNPSPDDFGAADWADKQAERKRTQREFDDFINNVYGRNEALHVEKLEALAKEVKDVLLEYKQVTSTYNSRGDELERITHIVERNAEQVLRWEKQMDAMVAHGFQIPESANAEKGEASKKCVDCGRQVLGDWTRCKTCVDKARKDRKKSNKAKGKEPALVLESAQAPKEKPESIQTGSQLIKPLHLGNVVKMAGLTVGKKSEFKNGVVVRGSLLTCAHGPVNGLEIANPKIQPQQARLLVKENETQDLAVYQCPSGAFGKVSVRSPKRGEDCYITFFAAPGDAGITTSQGKILETGDQEKVHGSHSCSTPKQGGASGAPIWATSDGALIGIHTGAADPTGPNKFAMISNEKVWEGLFWPSASHRPEN